jgi:hypothetical protein
MGDLKLQANDKIVINVSGMRFETLPVTLNRFPNTLLGNPQKRQKYFDYNHNEYFFERHRQSFESILFYYQSKGRFLLRPLNVSSEIFFDEIVFFQLGEEAIVKYKKDEGYLIDKQAKIKDLPKNRFLRSIWLLFEYPESSYYARCVAIVSVIVIFISIALFCIETLPSVKTKQNLSPTAKDDFFLIETICTMWFTTELLMRFIASPNKLAFVKQTGNIIDLFSILPYFLQTLFSMSSKLDILRIVRLVRVFRVFKLARHFKGLQILVQTFVKSAKELLLLGLFLMIGVILFSSCVYFSEIDTPASDFDSIPHGFWYALITMTTVSLLFYLFFYQNQIIAIAIKS